MSPVGDFPSPPVFTYRATDGRVITLDDIMIPAVPAMKWITPDERPEARCWRLATVEEETK